MGMHYLQSRIVRVNSPDQFLALLAVQLSVRQPLEGGLFAFGHLWGSIPWDSTRRSARSAITSQTLQRGQTGPGLPGTLATKLWTAAIEVRLKDGHKGTKVKATIACRARSPNSLAQRPPLWGAAPHVSDSLERAPGRGLGLKADGSFHGRSNAGFREKKPHGTSLNPAACTGITGQSSGRGLCVIPMEYQSTTS